MRRTAWVLGLGLPLLMLTTVRAGVLQPGNTSVSVDCNFKFKVTDAVNGSTLQLQASDPIFTKPCISNGIGLSNRGRNAVNRLFTLDCTQGGTLMGSGGAVGIRLKGPGLTVRRCMVSGFGIGVVASGDGEVIEDSIAQNSAGNGFEVRGRLRTTNLNVTGTMVSSDQSVNNAGFGFALKGNGLSVDNSGNIFLSSLADGNRLGGFSLTGRENTISGCDATNNGGPGFSVAEKSCCSVTYSFDTSRAVANAGPGIVYLGRDDGSNCIGGVCYPAGVDLSGSATGIFALDNRGQCPPGTVPFPATSTGQICLAATKCSPTELSHC